MGLEKQEVPIPLSGGLREDVDPLLVEPPFVLDLENVEFDKDGVLNKAPGARAVTTTGLPSAGDPNGLMPAGEHLGIIAPDGLYILAEEHTRSRKPHELGMKPCEVHCSTFMSGEEPVLYVSAAYANGFECYVYEQAGLAFVLVREAETGAICFGPTALAGTNSTPRPKVVAYDTDQFLIAANEETDGAILFQIDSTDLPLALTSSVLIPGNVTDSLKDLHALVGETSAYVLVGFDATTTTIYRVANSGGTPILATSEDITTADPNAISGAVMHLPGVSLVWVAIMDGTWDIDVYIGNESTLSGITSAAQTFTASFQPAAAGMYRLAMAPTNENNDVALMWSVSGRPLAATTPFDLSHRSMLEFRLLDSGGGNFGADADYDTFPNLVLKTHGFRESARGACFGVAWDWQSGENEKDALETDGTNAWPEYSTSNVGLLLEVTSYTTLEEGEEGQTAEVITRFGCDVIGRYHVGTARGHLSTASHDRYTHHVSEIGAGKWLLGIEQQTGRAFNDYPLTGQIVALPNAFAGGRVEIDLEPSALRVVQVDREICTSGGVVWMYDGLQAQESAPHVTPERPDVLDPGTGAGPGTSGYFRYKVLYLWEDAAGNLHRSAPSIASRKIGVDDLSTSDVRVLYSLPPPTANARKYGRRIIVEIYRTGNLASGASEASYFRIFRGEPTPDSDDPNSGRYTDQALGAQVYNPDYGWTKSTRITGPELYTDGGELESQAPPAPIDVLAAGNRIWLISGDDPSTLWPSKTLVPGYAPEWNANLTVRVPGMGGDGAVALAAIDEKVIIFKRRAIYYVVGDGPNNLGAGGDFPLPSQISGEVGCISRVSVAQTPDGVLFQSEAGIYLLDRALSLHYIGGPVEDSLAGQTIVSAVAVPSKHQVRFGLATPSVDLLVYDYLRKQWSVWIDRVQVAAALWNGTYVYTKNTYAICAEDPSVYTVPGGTSRIRITTAWIKASGLQNFKRLWRTLFLGRWYTGDLEVRADYDYDGQSAQTRSWTAAELTSLTATTRMQIELHHARQKIEAVRYRFTEATTLTGRGFVLAGLSLVMGMKPGGRYKNLAPAARK